MGHTFSKILLHVIFSTKGRKNTLYQEMRSPLLAYVHGIARNEEVQILAGNAVEDHIHLLLAVKPVSAPAELVKTIKANSSRWIHEKHIHLRDFAWQSGYGIFSVSESAAGSVVAYIANQEQHHHRMPFAEELRLLLEKHGIEYDPEHYLD